MEDDTTVVLRAMYEALNEELIQERLFANLPLHLSPEIELPKSVMD